MRKIKLGFGNCSENMTVIVKTQIILFLLMEGMSYRLYIH